MEKIHLKLRSKIIKRHPVLLMCRIEKSKNMNSPLVKEITFISQGK